MRYHRVDVHLNVATIKTFRATSSLRLPYMYQKLRAEKAIFQLFGPFFLDSRATRQRAENRLIKNHQNTEFLKFMRASVDSLQLHNAALFARFFHSLFFTQKKRT